MDYPHYHNEPQKDSTYHFRAEQLDSWDQWNQQPPQKEKPKSKGWTPGRVIALTLCASLVSGILGAGGAIAYHLLSRDDASVPIVQSAPESSVMLEGEREEIVIDTQQVDTSKQMTPAQVYAQNVNSTVGLTTAITTNYWGYQTTSAASGSGFILTSDGYILTNYHVIEGSSAITVTCYNGDSYEAELIGYDESNDIAVLKTDAHGLTPVVLGSSDKMHVGDSVLAIGNPLGELTFSLTTGAISALQRQVTMSNGVTMELIQTDCAINSGNSGGALFNLYGEVVGITNAKYSSSSSGASIDNIGFAIPIDDVRGIITSIIEKGYISKPYIGVSVLDVSEETQQYGLPAGAAVQAITADSPAEQAGLQVTDIITQVNGTAIGGSSDLVAFVGKCNSGDTLKMQVYRQGEYLQITLTVGEQVQQAMEQPEIQSAPSYWGR